MIKSRFDSRAKAINPNNPLHTRTFACSPAEYWEKNVQSKEDVVKFYKIYYPELPDTAIEAIARSIQDAVDGKKELSDQWMKNK